MNHRVTRARRDGGMHILVVDDDRVMRAIYQQALELDSFAVDTAADGAEALEKIVATSPDLLVLDIFMPVMDGWELLERVRNITSPPVVVVVSGTLDRARAKELGAAAAFSKPFRLAELRATCVRLLAAT